ncbi:hypothetical protein IRJ41_024742 [Triplophysa rosa]|uniref:Uncharacterized protein n=1 Tax=Triplophysa rosa TaxID=992332 RepID=A0A9W7TLG6_TRIRA|nr:hypothetical protein IRJ41_024742 [Triplophysa rosa]
MPKYATVTSNEISRENDISAPLRKENKQDLEEPGAENQQRIGSFSSEEPKTVIWIWYETNQKGRRVDVLEESVLLLVREEQQCPYCWRGRG